jgi:DnaJ-class molecular chaperone
MTNVPHIIGAGEKKVPFRCPWCNTEPPAYRIEVTLQQHPLLGAMQILTVYCDGFLPKPCDECDGTGIVHDSIAVVDCPTCAGTGRIRSDKKCAAIFSVQVTADPLGAIEQARAAGILK